jgi:hypothetical protein
MPASMALSESQPATPQRFNECLRLPSSTRRALRIPAKIAVLIVNYRRMCPTLRPM